MGDESMLRARAREAMKAGNLPDHRPERMWGGPGSGAPCAVCGETVEKEGVELELQFASEGGRDAANYHVHAPCFAAWELERRNRGPGGRPNGRSLPLADNGGIIPAHESNTRGRGERG